MSGLYFSQIQINMIQEAFEQAKASNKFDAAYKKVASMLPSGKVRLWFEDAAQANANQELIKLNVENEHSQRSQSDPLDQFH